jgi:hypothetical protein
MYAFSTQKLVVAVLLHSRKKFQMWPSSLRSLATLFRTNLNNQSIQNKNTKTGFKAAATEPGEIWWLIQQQLDDL